MGLQPRRAAGPCPPAGRCAALPWARGEEQEGVRGEFGPPPAAQVGGVLCVCEGGVRGGWVEGDETAERVEIRPDLGVIGWEKSNN